MSSALSINIKFTESASRLLLPSPPLTFPSAPLAQQSLAVGDKLRFADIANCPWFVVTQRYWDLGAAQVTLTIWLGAPDD